ncbi:MAG: ATP-binding protein [Candidatus Omnitrophota bacterium]
MTILIVDDNKQNIYLLQVLLQGSGYKVVAAANGAEALVQARQDLPDLIISDILMPVMDGFSLCREWKKDERLRLIPFIFYTATYTDERDREFALSLGAQLFIIKPEEPDVFVRKIREVIQLAQRPSGAPLSIPVETLPQEESSYLKQYNEVLIHKLETKLEQLDKTNHELAFKAMLLEISTEASIDGILAVDSDGRVILTNKRFNELWKMPDHLLEERDDSKIMECALKQLKDPQEFSRKVAYLYDHKDEKSRDEIEFSDGRCFDRYSAPLRGADGKYYGRIWYFRDITVRKEVEDLRRIDKLKKNFISNMSHELRTPLNAVIGFSEVLYDQKFGVLNETQKDYLNDILESSKFLLSLINDILDLSKIEVGKAELACSEFSLKELLEHGLLFVREKALKHNIELYSEIDDGVGSVTADERKVKQIVFNLLSNAVKFTPDGGKVGIKARINGSDAEVTVWDTGIGISKEDQAKLFRPFMQLEVSLDKKYEGTGLGLSLAKEIVELHKGKIWVESEGSGKGSRFTFSLPIGAV